MQRLLEALLVMNGLGMLNHHPLSLRQLNLYFLKLGTICFGGPVVLVQQMHEDLIRGKSWFSEEEFNEGLSLSQMSPGPLATQIAIYLSWLRFGKWGSLICLVSFLLPSFLIVVTLAVIYQKYGALPWMQNIFANMNPSVLALVGLSSWRFARKTIKKETALWIISLTFAIASSYWQGIEIKYFILAAAIGAIAGFYRDQRPSKPSKRGGFLTLPFTLPFALSGPFIGIFLKAGAAVFGSGLAIVPFLQKDLVHNYHLLTQTQFIDSVSVAMISPGPVVITTAFMGFLIDGGLGALSATVATFLPCYIITILVAPLFKKLKQQSLFRGAIDGLTAAAVGSLVGVTWVMGMRTLTTPTALGISTLSLGIFLKWNQIPPILIFIIFALSGFF